MFLADILFYLFSATLLISACVVISTRNTVYSVMFLILAFFNAAGLFVLLGAEFLAMLLIIVYVGAIAVLFLFVVMMLNIDQKMEKKFNKYTTLVILISVILFIEMCLIIQSSSMSFGTVNMVQLPIVKNISNTKALGDVLYTKFAYPFQLSGLILFVAMVGAIVLTLRDQDRFIKKQNIGEQVARTSSQSIRLVKVRVGKGVDLMIND